MIQERFFQNFSSVLQLVLLLDVASSPSCMQFWRMRCDVFRCSFFPVVHKPNVSHERRRSGFSTKINVGRSPLPTSVLCWDLSPSIFVQDYYAGANIHQLRYAESDGGWW